jgi:hypothetical protein
MPVRMENLCYTSVCVCVFVCVDGDVLVLELKEFYTRYTSDVIATAAFGIGVDSFKQPTNEFYMSGQDLTDLGGLRAFKMLAFVTMPKLMQVRAPIHTYIHTYHIVSYVHKFCCTNSRT